MHSKSIKGKVPGFVSLVREKVLFRELKTDKGKLSPHQKLWGDETN